MTDLDATFLIADLAGYTALIEAHGGAEGAALVDRYVALVRGALSPGARLVERVGDEVMVLAPDPADGLRTAVALGEAVEREPLFPLVRMGLHAGPAVEREGRYFGTAVNLAARVAAHARAGQILCTAPVAAAARAGVEVSFAPLGPLRFRNVLDPVEVFEVVPAHGSRGATVLDPVCRMRVSAEDAPARLPWDGRTYHFCSLDCARRFAARPEDYAGRG